MTKKNRNPRWHNLRTNLWILEAVSWRIAYRKVWAGRRYALIVIRREPKDDAA